MGKISIEDSGCQRHSPESASVSRSTELLICYTYDLPVLTSCKMPSAPVNFATTKHVNDVLEGISQTSR